MDVALCEDFFTKKCHRKPNNILKTENLYEQATSHKCFFILSCPGSRVASHKLPGQTEALQNPREGILHDGAFLPWRLGMKKE